MRKFKVIRIDFGDEEIGLKIGDIVEETKYKTGNFILCRLPKRLSGNGHNGNRSSFRLKANDYRYFLPYQLEEIICQ